MYSTVVSLVMGDEPNFKGVVYIIPMSFSFHQASIGSERNIQFVSTTFIR